MTNRSFNTNYTSGGAPSGIWRAEVTAIDGSLLSIKIPRLAMNNVYENVPYIGFTPSVGDRVWVGFIEGNSANPVVFTGANDVDSDITDIVAGIGISGGGSSGTVTLDFEPSELSEVVLTYDDKIVISDDSDGGEPKLVPMSDLVTVVHGDGGGEPIGHSNKSDSVISFNYSSRIFTISPAADSYEVWCKGKKFVKTESETVTIPNSTNLYYISFDEDGVLQATTTFFVWDSETPTAYIYFNASEPAKYMLFDERHGIVLDWQTHEYLHRTRGAAFANGFNVDFTGNNGSLPSPGDYPEDAQIDLDGGTFFDEDLQVDITHSNTPVANTWEQDLQGPARIPVFYVNSSGGWTYDAPTDYPVKKGSLRPTYNLYSGGSWTTPDLGANQYGIYWIVATNQLNYPVLSLMGQGEYSNVGEAEAVTWDSMSLTNLPIVEIRVLYKIIVRATGSNTPGCYFEQIADFRTAATATSAGTTVSDHGNLTGLGDDDHPQYLTEARGDLLYADISTSPTITLGGNASGSVTLTNLGSGTLTVTVGDSDKVDGFDASQFLRSDVADTAVGVITASGGIVASGGISGLTATSGISGSNFNITGVNQLEINDPGEGIVWKNGASGDINLYVVDDASDNILRTNGNFVADGSITSGGNIIAGGSLIVSGDDGIGTVTGDYGSVQTVGSGAGGWEGYSIHGWAVFMANSSTGNFGIYDDVNNQWALYCDFNGFTELRHAGSAKLTTTSSGVTVTGDVTSSSGVLTRATPLNPPYRFYDATTSGTVNHTLPTSISGVSVSGAIGVFLSVTAVPSTSGGFGDIQPYGSSNVGSTVNFDAGGEVKNGFAFVPLDSSRRFSSYRSVSCRFILDIRGLVF